MPDFIFLQCYFDQNWKQPLASDTRLNLRMAWKRNSNGQYERSEFFVETAYKNRIIRTKRDNCPTKDCKIEIQTLKFPATVDENLEFDFSVNTPIVDNNDKYMFNSRISFKGVAEFHRSI